MRNKISVALIVVMVLGGTSILTGCNTMEGAGKDVAKAGDKVSDEARKNK